MNFAGDTRHKIQRILPDICSSYPEIIAVYLFGSQAAGRARPESDFDIALLLKQGSAQEFDYLSFKITIESTVCKEADLVVLNTAGAPIKHQVRRHGKLVFDRDPQTRIQWEILSRKFYQDFIHLHAIYMFGMKNALRSSSHGG